MMYLVVTPTLSQGEREKNKSQPIAQALIPIRSQRERGRTIAKT